MWQAMYQLSQPGATRFKLWHFNALMGVATIFCAQAPTLHSQRLLNGIAMANTACFSLMMVVLSIYQGLKLKTIKDYGKAHAIALLQEARTIMMASLGSLFSFMSLIKPCSSSCHDLWNETEHDSFVGVHTTGVDKIFGAITGTASVMCRTIHFLHLTVTQPLCLHALSRP